MTVISARYRGKCPACGEAFPAGTPVYWDEDGWRHESCVEVTPERHRAVEYCQKCFLQRPCEHDE